MNVHNHIIHNSQKQKQIKRPSAAEWINKMWSVYGMENHPALEIMQYWPYATTWMNFKNIMLSKSSQLQKATYYMILFIKNVQNRQIHTDWK